MHNIYTMYYHGKQLVRLVALLRSGLHTDEHVSINTTTIRQTGPHLEVVEVVLAHGGHAGALGPLLLAGL